MKYHFQVHKEAQGYWAECLELKGCRTQAENLDALQKNMREVLNLYLDEPEDSKALMALPRKKISGRNIHEVKVDPTIAFAFYLRRTRLERGLTQRETADKLHLKNIYSYQRLESSKTANPEFATIVELKRVFPELKIDEILSA